MVAAAAQKNRSTLRGGFSFAACLRGEPARSRRTRRDARPERRPNHSSAGVSQGRQDARCAARSTIVQRSDGQDPRGFCQASWRSEVRAGTEGVRCTRGEGRIARNRARRQGSVDWRRSSDYSEQSHSVGRHVAQDLEVQLGLVEGREEALGAQMFKQKMFSQHLRDMRMARSRVAAVDITGEGSPGEPGSEISLDHQEQEGKATGDGDAAPRTAVEAAELGAIAGRTIHPQDDDSEQIEVSDQSRAGGLQSGRRASFFPLQDWPASRCPHPRAGRRASWPSRARMPPRAASQSPRCTLPDEKIVRNTRRRGWAPLRPQRQRRSSCFETTRWQPLRERSRRASADAGQAHPEC